MTAPVRRTTIPSALGDHESRIRRGELSGERFIYVGTPGDGDVPDDAVLTPDSPPFQNTWTNSQGTNQLVSFALRDNQWVHIRGVAADGAYGTVVFTLPEGYRPMKTTRTTGVLSTDDGLAPVRVDTNGDVTILDPIGSGDCCGIAFEVDPQEGAWLRVTATGGPDPDGDYAIQIEATDSVNGTIGILATGYANFQGKNVDITNDPLNTTGQINLIASAEIGLYTNSSTFIGGVGTGDIGLYAIRDNGFYSDRDGAMYCDRDAYVQAGVTGSSLGGDVYINASSGSYTSGSIFMGADDEAQLFAFTRVEIASGSGGQSALFDQATSITKLAAGALAGDVCYVELNGAGDGGVGIRASASGLVSFGLLGASSVLTIVPAGAEMVLGPGDTFTVYDSTANPIFRVDEDGDLHGKTGKALTFDL